MGFSVRLAQSAALAATLMVAICPGGANAQPHPPPSVLNFPLRSPQVRVNGTGLQQLFDTWGENSQAARDQVEVELLREQFSLGSPIVIGAELSAQSAGTTSGIYWGHDADPTHLPVFPGTAAPGWFAAITFRSPPARVIVNVFDAEGNPFSSTISLGGDRLGIGFYLSGPGGTFYSQDFRNPGATPQLLFIAGTGYFASDLWMAGDDQSVANGSDADYDDVLWRMSFAPGSSSLTAVHHASWGQVKARFH